MKILNKIQKELKVPKNQKNTFGGYSYRSCEDILEAVKPLLGEATLSLTDEMRELGGRVYVQATATLSDGENSVTVSAYAREAESKKGMDESQITGAASSYARKYALNGLFLIDDTRDADTQDNTAQGKEKHDVSRYLADIEKINEMNELQAYWKLLTPKLKTNIDLLRATNEQKKAIQVKEAVEKAGL